MFKNVASQSVTLWAVDATTGLPKTGDAANMVFYISKDDGSVTAIAAGGTGVPTECDATNAKGDYKIALTQTETNADKLRFSGKSSTSNVVILPQTIYTVPSAFGLVGGAAGGLMISGSNTATTFATLTVTGATTLTGNVVLSDGLTVSAPSTSNRAGITITGNGTGAGIISTGGSTGNGVSIVGGASGHGLSCAGTGTTKHGIIATGGTTTSAGLNLVGGGTSGDGMLITATSGHGINVSGAGTTKHGIFAQGGATTSAGIAAAGGGTSGDGILITATSGHGISSTGAGTTKHGIHAAGGATTSHGINAIGGGVGHGILATSGSGSTGDGIRATAASTNGNGFNLLGVGTGAGLLSTGGATGIGLSAVGGATSGDAIKAVTTSGHGLNLAPVGTGMHGLLATGGNGATSDGIKAVAGTGGVPIRGDITGNITGNLVGTVSTLTTYTGNTPQTGDAYAIVNSGTFGNSALKTLIDTVDDYIDTEVAAIKTKTDFLPSATAGSSGGLLISGSNSGTTTLGALTVTGATTLTGAVTGTNASNDLRVNMTALGGSSTPITNMGIVFNTDFAANYNTTLDMWNVNTTYWGGVVTSIAEVNADVTLIAGNSVQNSGTVDFDLIANLNATITSRMATYTQPTGFLAATFPTTVASTTNITAASGVRLSATGVDDIWDEVQSGHTTAGTFGKYLDAQVSTVGGGTAASIADAVWDEVLSGHLTSGTTGAALNAAGSAGDPWTTTLPGSYTGSSAGFKFGTLFATALNILHPYVGQDSSLELVIGDDYYAADNRNIQFTYGASPSLSGATVYLDIQTDTGKAFDENNRTVTTGSASGTTTQLVTFDLPGTTTTSFDEGWRAYRVRAVLSGGHTVTLTRGRVNMLSRGNDAP